MSPYWKAKKLRICVWGSCIKPTRRKRSLKTAYYAYCPKHNTIVARYYHQRKEVTCPNVPVKNPTV